MDTDPGAITEAELAEALARRHVDKPRDGAEFLARVLVADIADHREPAGTSVPPSGGTVTDDTGRAPPSSPERSREGSGGSEEGAPDPIGDLKAELGEARSEAQMIRTHAHRYLAAVYGPDYVYRAPETFGNLLERWIWAVAAEVPEMAHASIADIERHCAERDEAEHA